MTCRGLTDRYFERTIIEIKRVMTKHEEIVKGLSRGLIGQIISSQL